MSKSLTESEVIQIKKAASILLKDITTKITIPELSKEVRLDEKKLKLGFRLIFGKGINAFVQGYRLEKAKELLYENKPLKLIARATGYKEPSSLIKAFRKKVGESPASWRKKSSMYSPDWTTFSPE
jgi:AraC-like DNA-binding protein